MSKVQAWQHIYSNVEKEHSPQNRGGFQTLFYSRAGLTESEIEEMEAHLLYFPSEIEPVKHVFFFTSTGKMVVGQIVSLPEPDKAGRGGRYLAHSLIFAPEEFNRLGINPFRVFRHFPFITTVVEALERGDFQTGDIPKISFDFPEDSNHIMEAAKQWSPAELKKLTRLALNSGQMARDHSTVAFVGEPQEIERALEAAFLSVPLRLRLRCSFDTYFYRCNLVATYYWGIGLSQTTNPKLIVVDARSKQVKQEFDYQAQSAYERWVMAAIEANNLTHIAQYKDHAFALCELLHNRPGDASLLDQIPPEAIRSVFQVNAQQVREQFRFKLGEQLPPLLVDRIFERVYSQNNPMELVDRLRRRFELPRLLDAVYETYTAHKFHDPGRKERKVLGQLLQQTNHPDLGLLFACWSGSKELRQALEQATNEEYCRFVREALRFELVEPLTLLVPGKGKPFVDLYPEAKESDVVTLVKELLEIGEKSCLSQLVLHIQGLQKKDLRALRKIAQQQPDLPKTFCQGIEQAIAALPQKGLKKIFRKLFGKS